MTFNKKGAKALTYNQTPWTRRRLHDRPGHLYSNVNALFRAARVGVTYEPGPVSYLMKGR
jgi:hypothetical protein